MLLSRSPNRDRDRDQEVQMGQSLAEAAVRGTSTLTDEKRELLAAGDIEGLLALNRTTFGGFTMMAKEDDVDDDDADDDDDDDSDDDDDDDDDDDEDDEDDKGKRKPSAERRRIRELIAESTKHRKRASERGRRIAELEAEVAQLKKGSKAKGKDDEDDSDEDDSEAAKLKEENEKLQQRVVQSTLRTEFTDLTTGPKALAEFKNPKAAFRLLDLDDVEIDEDGDIIGLDEAIKALAKSEPYLLADKAKQEDDDEDDDDEDKPRRRRTGTPAGGNKRKKGNPNREKLLSKYPALRR
jgi:hypothetical protein